MVRVTFTHRIEVVIAPADSAKVSKRSCAPAFRDEQFQRFFNCRLSRIEAARLDRLVQKNRVNVEIHAHLLALGLLRPSLP